MPDLTAKRTLVKSPPELWEELSEVERLAKHLGAFGEITITKLEPEHTVAWEGEHASGTVSIEPSGWGTKVTLRAELPERETPEPAEPEPTPAEPEPTPEVEPLAEDSMVEEPAQIAAEEPAADAPRRGFWAWLFRPRRAQPERVAERHPQPEPAAEEPSEREPLAGGLAAEPERVPEAEPVAEAPAQPKPVAEAPAHAEPVVAALGEPEPVAEEPALEVAVDTDDDPGLDPERARLILDEALDTLGAAHHRPFSRG